MIDHFKTLRENLHTNPAGAPASETFDEILRILFTADEAAVASVLNFVPTTLQEIAGRAGLAVGRAGELCEAMANKGVIFSREKKGNMLYSLVPTIPGLFEFPFMAGAKTAMHVKLGRLWDDYHLECQGHEFGASPTPMVRVMPVEEPLSEKSCVMPYEVLSEMVKKCSRFALAQCACRESMGEKACDRPKDVCLIYDSMAAFLIERSLAKEITREEALGVLKRSEEAGLVHVTNNSRDRLNLTCNCCPCCCTILTGLTKIKSPHPFAVARWYARADESACTACGICRDERCPVRAIEVEDTVRIDAERCIGCGLCVSECPAEAIWMEQREKPVDPPETVHEMGGRVLMEKGRLEAYMALNNR